MKQHRIPAVFMRGGTSKGLMVREEHLPADRRKWDPLFLAALGSPDPNGRQLDGMGGGLSSLSKVCVIGASTRSDADVDYTFGQVQIKEAHVDWTPLCGNMSTAVGPYAVDEGLVNAGGDTAVVRIHNTNTKKIIVAHFPLDDGYAAVDGDLTIPGITDTGAPVRLDFLDPGGATTGKLLPTGSVVDRLEVLGFGTFEVSMIDASNACIFLRATDIGLTGTEMPAEIEANATVMRLLSAIRLAASVRVGIAADEREAVKKTAVPFIGFVAPPTRAVTLSGEVIDPGRADLVARVISNGQLHRALPLSVSMCLGVASKIAGSIVHAAAAGHAKPDELLVSMPSGILQLTAEVCKENGTWRAVRGGFYRTQRRLFEGHLLVRASALQ
ncbi:MAG: PrpF family protein [Gammaproteobacteria bacterium]|nr:PrpF family protein [Gammaproteobacteria bacterium]